MGNMLMRIAFTNSTPSALAVLRSLLALSSLHRYGVQEQALEFKLASLKALAESAAAEVSGTREVIQHVAAGMMLLSFEVS
jgi:hypothetical protein